MRKRTGLHNRGKRGRSAYALRKKRSAADRYGTWDNGRRTGSEVVAGRSLTYDMRAGR